MEFKKNGISILLNRKVTESNDLFTSRGWFIVSQKPHDIFNNYDELLKLSEIWINHKFKNCKYNSQITRRIRSMERNLGTSTV